jgi:hypothetical protein
MSLVYGNQLATASRMLQWTPRGRLPTFTTILRI